MLVTSQLPSLWWSMAVQARTWDSQDNKTGQGPGKAKPVSPTLFLPLIFSLSCYPALCFSFFFHVWPLRIMRNCDASWGVWQPENLPRFMFLSHAEAPFRLDKNPLLQRRHFGIDQGNLTSTHLAGHMKGVLHCRALLPDDIDVPVCHIQAVSTRYLMGVQMWSMSRSGNANDLPMKEGWWVPYFLDYKSHFGRKFIW